MALLLFLSLWVVAGVIIYLWDKGTIKRHKYICVFGIMAVYLTIFSTVPVIKNMDHSGRKQNSSTASQEMKMYPANSNSKVFHRENCKYVDKISDSNYEVFFDRKDAVQAGYRPCKVCNP